MAVFDDVLLAAPAEDRAVFDKYPQLKAFIDKSETDLGIVAQFAGQWMNWQEQNWDAEAGMTKAERALRDELAEARADLTCSREGSAAAHRLLKRQLRALQGKWVEAQSELANSDVRSAAADLLDHQLETFLEVHWDKTPLADEWTIRSTPEAPNAGRYYVTDVGQIDFLAVHKQDRHFLVVQLKRNLSIDQTVGQVLRYIGWIQKHLAKGEASVEGLIIARNAEDEASYALSSLANVKLMTYEFEFQLRSANPLVCS